ncbi:peroxiredoxin [Brevibacillus fluminis]|uniref:Peroxiredoxin n=1 Tax=Brevibacillus fluminis TaxID=511487 RepID=A0A3M8DEW7_9BACL|nr:peroxiredoxin [Brevibacillus fluminis]RNB85875.1 peroxiredoxin [Brevibacillus fluminis]
MAQRLIGLPAPDFNMKTALGNGQEFGHASLSDYKGKWLVLFFYPLDFTFVCPTEIIALSDAIEDFKDLDAEVLGVSTDSVHSHKAWINTSREQNGLGGLHYPLASDNLQTVAKAYGVLDENEGIAFRGLFIIDPEGVLKYQVVTDLNVGRSVDETLRVLQALQSGGLCAANWRPGQANL